MYGGTFIRLLIFISLLGVTAGLMLPIVIEELLKLDEYKDQKRAEVIVEQSAQWYVINNGTPSEVMTTEQVKKTLIPHYLNKWPGKEPIECEIYPNGEIMVFTVDQSDQNFWLKIKDWFMAEIMVKYL